MVRRIVLLASGAASFGGRCEGAVGPRLVGRQLVPGDWSGRRPRPPNRPTLRPKLIWFNLGLTVALLTLLGLDILPLALVFIAATAVALVVNFPKQDDQVAAIKSHASSIVSVSRPVTSALSAPRSRNIGRRRWNAIVIIPPNSARATSVALVNFQFT